MIARSRYPAAPPPGGSAPGIVASPPDVRESSVAPESRVGRTRTRTRWARAARAGLRCAIGITLGVWSSDVLLAVHAYAAMGAKRWAIGLGAALFVGLTSAIAVGAAAGPIVLSVASSFAGGVYAWVDALRRGDRDVRHAVAAGCLTLLGLGGLGGWLAYRVPLAIELELARPESIAGALVVSHFAFLAVMIAAWPAATRAARAAVDRCERVPVLRTILARTWGVPAVAALAVLSVAVAWGWAHGAEIRALRPWARFAVVPAGLAGFALAFASRRLTAPWKHRAMLALVDVCLLGSCLAASQLRPESSAARKLAFDRTVSGRLGYAVWTALFDFDGDGQLNLLGGGDCAPFDARRHIGAVEIPGNGIDEDCDGEDLAVGSWRRRPPTAVGRAGLPNKPNIVFVTIDGLAARRLASIGGQSAAMPHVDQFAEGAAVFTHCFSEGPSTRLSFPSMFTSRWDSQLDHLYAPHHPYSLAASERQLQDVMNEAGYQTVAVIPNQYFSATTWSSLTRGFQVVDVSAMTYSKQHNAEQVTDAALRALSTARERPLFLWVHYYDAHGPYQPVSGVHYASANDEESYYESELTLIDGALDRLLGAITARSDASYVFLSADHGTVFGPNQTSRKGHYGYDLYTSTLHVPLIVRGPGIAPGRVDSIVSTMDVAPTIADLLRVPGSTFEGTSLLPEVLSSKSDPHRLVFHQFYLPERNFLRGLDPLSIVSVRSDRYDLILDRVGGTFELYDWRADYDEQHDLYEDSARSPEVLHLRSVLGAFLQQVHTRAPGAALLEAPKEGR